MKLDQATENDVDAISALRAQVAEWLVQRGIDMWQSPVPRERIITWVARQELYVHRDSGTLVGRSRSSTMIPTSGETTPRQPGTCTR